MEIGDIVGRAYVWPDLVSGIIVDRHEEDVRGIPSEGESSFAYSSITFTVAWSDGSLSNELDLELEYFDDMLKTTTRQES